MISIIIAALLAVAPADDGLATPDAVWSIALLDLVEHTAPADQPYTRYLSLQALPPDRRADYLKVVTYAVNSTSWRSELSHPAIIANGLLIKLDLRSLAWDFPSRVHRLAELERRGVNFGFKGADERRLFLDPWEQLALADPFFQVGYYKQHEYIRGWLDPGKVNAARHLSRSLKFVLRADWAIGRLWQEKQFGGIYSDLLMFPPNEADVYRAFLIDIRAVERDNQLRQGGAVLESIVALHNRGLEFLPSPYGQGGNRVYAQTYDFNVDARGNKSVLEGFAGALDHDGRESIGSLPNGLQWYLLFDGQGKQAAVVPEDIAQIKIAQQPIRETRVINAYKCLQCHQSGYYPFEDVVRKAFLSESTILKVKGYGHGGKGLAAALEDYYSSTLGRTISTYNAAFIARVQECTGVDSTTINKLTVDAVESYTHDLVTPEMAAREMGYPVELARLYLLAASDPDTAREAARQLGLAKGSIHYCAVGQGNPQAAVLASGQPIRRAAFEQSFGDITRAVSYPWEHRKK